MELEDFLPRLLDFGCHADYFSLESIGSIDKSCCPKATTQVIDKVQRMHEINEFRN